MDTPRSASVGAPSGAPGAGRAGAVAVGGGAGAGLDGCGGRGAPGNGCGTGCWAFNVAIRISASMPQIINRRDFCRAERPWLLDTIEALVSLESPTTDKAAVDRCGRELASRMERMGGRVSRLPRPDRGDHLLAEFGCGSSQLLLLGHFDTVWPVGQLERMPLRQSNGRLHGPGVFDMKAGIAIGMLAVRALLEAGDALARRIVMLWTTDEEVGSATSRAAIEDAARRSGAVLVLDPSLPGGAVKTARKGCGEYELVVRGVAAHAGIDPSKGASAIHELARQIMLVQQLQDLDRGVSVNVGTISGGTRTNVVAQEARAGLDVRPPTTPPP